MYKVLTLCGFSLLVGCANSAQVINYEQAGNLASTKPLACVSATSIGPQSSAADIAAGAKECADQSKYSQAAELIMVASAYAHFDTQRVADKTAHGALNALFGKEFGPLPDAEKRAVFSRIEALDKNPTRKGELCSFLVSATPPSYYPGYMIAHGMGASGEPLIKDFDAGAAWSRSMAFINCGR